MMAATCDGQVAGHCLLGARGHPPEVFNPANKAFYLVSIRPRIPVVRLPLDAIALRWYDNLDAQRFDVGDEPSR